MKWIVILSAALALLMAIPVIAHHSFSAEYDGSKPVTLTGTLKSVDWRNPHIYYMLDVKDSSGKVVTWTLEGYPPNMPVRRPEGWTSSSRNCSRSQSYSSILHVSSPVSRN